ncbi:nuclear protein DGCR14 [Amanita rubescens]|nr:nuclear protein DGCR14 [Amanita rubescens]
MSAPSTPLPERSLNRQVVLEEDEYTAALSQIIARDFFPSLVHLDATNNYLDALDTRDPHLIHASVRRLEEVGNTPLTSTRRHLPHQTPSQTPFGYGPSDTPLRTPRGEAPAKRMKYDTSINLDEFQAKYTSEDNSSFTQILEDENRKRKEKYAWAWQAQRRVEEQRDRMLEAREKMLIEAPLVTGVRERFKIEAPVPVGLLTNGSESDGQDESDETGNTENNQEKGKEMVLRTSNVDEEVDVMAPRKDTRPAGVDGWKFTARNSLMFAPDANQSPYHPSPKEGDAKPDPKVIKYGNTRLPEQEHSSTASQGASAPPSPTRSRIDAAIAGTPYRPTSPSNGGFKLVPSVPSPTPAELGPAAVRQLMTWGTLGATPRIISKPDDPDIPPPSTPFRLQDISSREAISHKLSSKASKSLRAKAGLLGLGQMGRTPGIATPSGRKGDMAPPSWTPRKSDAAGNLTPAARRLLERTTIGAAAAKAQRIQETDLNKIRWTPTPSLTSRR